MKRRDFVRTGLLSGTGLLATLAGTQMAAAANSTTPLSAPKQKNQFKLDYAPHFGMFENHAGKDLMDQLKFMADNGFTALEDNGMMARSASEQENIGNQLNKLGMKMGVFVIEGGDNWKTSLTTGKAEFKETFLKTCRAAVDVAKRTNAKWMTVVPGFYERNLPIGIQTANVIDALRGGAEIFEPHGLIMVLEPLSDTPELFLRHSDQTYALCKAVNSPSCKILYDVYHMQRNEGNLIPNIDLCWDEIAYFQIGDNPGRKEPTTGEINYKNVLAHIYKKGFRGVFGMEHGNSMPGKEGETALIEAYATVDDFKI
ncbi:MAG: TIM barrel protein [Bacteroidetes bacterium]|nr:TIM barrel protein [Bacteroidota bacterium]